MYLDVEAGGECALAGTGEDDGADVGVVGEFAEDGGEVEPHPVISERIFDLELRSRGSHRINRSFPERSCRFKRRYSIYQF